MIGNWKSNVLRNFDDSVGSYDLYSGVQDCAASRLSSFMPYRDAPEILEVGCGTGSLTRHLLERYGEGRFVVSDVAPQMIHTARKNLSDISTPIQWMVMDGEAAKFSRRFDLIVANMAVQWFADVEGGLRRLAGFLKPSGQLYYSLPGPRNFGQWKSALAETGVCFGGYNYEALPGVFEEDEFDVRYKDAHEFLRALKKTGAYTPRFDYKALAPDQMRRALRLCDERHHGEMTWHILYGCLEL